MTVDEYIKMLNSAIDGTLPLCRVAQSKDVDCTCRGCALEKNEGKRCPMLQLCDTRRALRYAVEHRVCGITSESRMDTAQVITFLRRAVVRGMSLRTLRECPESYITSRNLIAIDSY